MLHGSQLPPSSVQHGVWSKVIETSISSPSSLISFVTNGTSGRPSGRDIRSSVRVPLARDRELLLPRARRAARGVNRAGSGGDAAAARRRGGGGGGGRRRRRRRAPRAVAGGAARRATGLLACVISTEGSRVTVTTWAKRISSGSSLSMSCLPPWPPKLFDRIVERSSENSTSEMSGDGAGAAELAKVGKIEVTLHRRRAHEQSDAQLEHDCLFRRPARDRHRR